MGALGIISLVVYAFGVYAFGAILLMEIRGHRFGSDPSGSGPPRGHSLDWAILIVSLLWFVVCSLEALFWNGEGDWLRPLVATHALLLFLYPPLIAHATYADVVARSDRVLRHPAWRTVIAVLWIVAMGMALRFELKMSGVLPGRAFDGSFGLTIAGLFAATGIFCAAALTIARQKSESREQRSARHGTVVMLALMVLITIGVVVTQWGDSSTSQYFRFLATCLPLMFFFVGFYHEARFEFFDLFIKGGAFLLLLVVAIVAFSSIVGPWIETLGLGPGGSWAYALLFAPVILAVAWLQRRLGEILDNVWLGRRFTTLQAIKHFLSGMQSATSETELIAQAERGLGRIFQARARIDLEPARAAVDFACILNVPIRSQGADIGAILLGHRDNHAPYFSEDRALVGSLADVFSYMLENVRLQERKQQDERRAKELSLHASRTELKALRAQINPHFLFNALNAIAGLIHKDPQRADRTVEHLAEVFRYTLRGSQHEWASLEDELSVVRAYLDVEQARFGKRLQVDMKVEGEIRSVRILTMMVQTLAENAVKHGIACVRGPARIEIEARSERDSLIIEVRDSGPGFSDAEATGHRSRHAGFGLRNVRQRLQGYFGTRASLDIDRNRDCAMTVVSISMPLDEIRQSRSDRAAGGAA